MPLPRRSVLADTNPQASLVTRSDPCCIATSRRKRHLLRRRFLGRCLPARRRPRLYRRCFLGRFLPARRRPPVGPLILPLQILACPPQKKRSPRLTHVNRGFVLQRPEEGVYPVMPTGRMCKFLVFGCPLGAAALTHVRLLPANFIRRVPR